MNKHQRLKAVVLSTALSAGALFSGAASANQALDNVLAASQSKITSAKQSQQRVNKLQEESADLLQKFKRVNKDIEGLKVYNAQLEAQIRNQRQRIADLNDAIANVTVLQRQVPPLASRMLQSLEDFVKVDMPFQKEKRMDAIQNIKDNMSRADFTVAEKFRQVLELYSIESEYGRKVESYSGSLEIGGQEREVDFLAIGRIALVYQTKDAELTGAWDRSRSAWVELDAGEYKTAVTTAIKIADKRAALDVMSLPILAPEAAQ